MRGLFSNLFYIDLFTLKVDDDTLLVPRNVDALLATLDAKDKLLLGYMIEAEIDNTTKKFEGRMYPYIYIYIYTHLIIYIISFYLFVGLFIFFKILFYAFLFYILYFLFSLEG